MPLGNSNTPEVNVSNVRANFTLEESLLYKSFPEDFIWGVATSAYQVSNKKARENSNTS